MHRNNMYDKNESSDSRSYTALTHPRRRPAYKSVSLLHSPPKTQKGRHQVNTHNKDRSNTSTDTSSSLPLLAKKSSSGEISNAEGWFDNLNNNGMKIGLDTILDSEPPFFLRNSSSSDSPPEMFGTRPAHLHSMPTLPDRVGMMQTSTPGSSSDEFRSVIDDLTIENKNLKRKLRRYERNHDTRLHADKLFEIRMHGLSPPKKRELEETLQKFVSNLGIPTQHSVSGVSSKQLVRPASGQHFPNAASLVHTDSAYASMSGNNPSQSGSASKWQSISQTGLSHQTVQTYLHDMRSGSLPISNAVMPEKVKRKLVVKRLEQIFAGKGAATFGHQHSIQQQEVSQSAARVDRIASNADGQEAMEEGAREATIMPSLKGHGKNGSVIPPRDETGSLTSQGKGENDITTMEPLDQRPTRPLDLDLHRAQVGSDNIKYMRHLGFSPENLDSPTALQDDHGWVYLNVLSNMAQIHTVNVTPDFVKKSIAEYSKKLELSHDGRKVRWRGGSSLTRQSGDSSPGEGNTPNPRQSNSEHGSSSAYGEPLARLSRQAKHIGKADNLSYVPLFAHQEDSDSDDESDDNMSLCSAPPPETLAADSSGVISTAVPTAFTKRRARHEGPIIFYKKVNFCTDLSGDAQGCNLAMSNMNNYSTIHMNPIGMTEEQSATCEAESVADKKGALSQFDNMAIPDEMDVNSFNEGRSDVVTGFSKSPSLGNASSSDSSPNAIEFEASGIGGVEPRDNFSINIRSRLSCGNDQAPEQRVRYARNQLYPSRIRDILADSAVERRNQMSDPRPNFIEEIISSRTRDLPASELPEPSYYPFNLLEDEDDSDESEAGSETENDPMSRDGPIPAAAPQPMNWNFQNFHSSPEEDDEEECSSEYGRAGSCSSESIDMLAPARQADPVTIHAREREYDSNVADRLAEEIPAGGSAATAGGGSGFNSPNNDEGVEASEENVFHSDGVNVVDAIKATGLKRMRTTDSIDIEMGRAPKSPKVVT